MKTENPAARSFEWEGRTVTIEPRVFSGAVIDLIEAHCRRKRDQRLSDLLGSPGMPSVCIERLTEELLDWSFELTDLIAAIKNDPQVSAIVLRQCSNLDANDSEHCAATYSPFVELASIILLAAGVDELGKSLPLMELMKRQRDDTTPTSGGAAGGSNGTSSGTTSSPQPALTS